MCLFHIQETQIGAWSKVVRLELGENEPDHSLCVWPERWKETWGINNYLITVH